MIAARLVRIVLVFLAGAALQVGVWAAFAPQSFYDDFPGAGRIWVAVDGPYNEHLVRDVGELNLAIAVVTIWAVVVLSRTTVLMASSAWVVYSLPHFVYHLRHLDPYESSADKVGLVLLLGLLVLVPALVGWTAWRSPQAVSTELAAT